MQQYRNLYISQFFILIRCIWAVPMDYCMHPLNTKDCKMKPTPVFSYYRPGSRCDVEIWRGCPTMNKFNTEYECSHACIFRIKPGADEGATHLSETTPEGDVEMDAIGNDAESILHTYIDASTEGSPVIDDCLTELNTSQCSDKAEIVYTYDNNSCINKTWWGCPTKNKFRNQITCSESCVVKNESEWKEELKAESMSLILNVDAVIKALKETLIKTRTELLTTATTKEVTSPTTKEVISPTTKEVISPTTKDVISSTTKEVISSTTKEVISPTTKEFTSPTTKEVISPTTKEVISPTTKEVISSTTKEITFTTTKEVTTSATTPTTFTTRKPEILELSESSDEDSLVSGGFA